MKNDPQRQDSNHRLSYSFDYQHGGFWRMDMTLKEYFGGKQETCFDGKPVKLYQQDEFLGEFVYDKKIGDFRDAKTGEVCIGKRYEFTHYK